MTLSRKTNLWFLLIGLTVALLSGSWVYHARTLQARFRSYAHVTTPSLIALGQIKAALLEVAVGASGEAIQKRLDDWLALMTQMAARTNERGALVEAMRRGSEVLRRRLNELATLRQQGATEETIARAQHDVDRVTDQLVRVIDQAMARELVQLKGEQEEMSHRMASAVQQSLFAAGFLLLIALVAGVFVARAIVRPIGQLAKDAAVVGTGDLTWRSHVHSRDEIGALASAFNQMTETLQHTTVSKSYVDNILHSMLDMLVVADADGTIRTVNTATLTRLGYAEDELIGQRISQLVAAVQGTTIDSLLNTIVSQGAVSNIEQQWRTKDGHELPVLFAGALMRDAHGQAQGIVCVALDITERKRAEQALQRAQEQLIQSEKLAALGRFSAGVAHEVKNPLAIILSGIESLQQSLATADDDTKAALSIIERSVMRADTIVRDLLKFARPSALVKERATPDALVQDAIGLLTHSGSLKHVTVDTHFAHDGVVVAVDKNQLQQVLLNLMMNAVEAMRQGGSLRLSTSQVKSDGQRLCAIAIADTGEGIAAEHLSRLFEPFFTTKRDRKGTGLGLSVSKTIVESHGGTLQVESDVGRGTTMTIRLPILEEGASA